MTADDLVAGRFQRIQQAITAKQRIQRQGWQGVDQHVERAGLAHGVTCRIGEAGGDVGHAIQQSLQIQSWDRQLPFAGGIDAGGVGVAAQSQGDGGPGRHVTGVAAEDLR
ncbi:hypothetical protein D3C81_1795630 [compost metagenome]